MTRLISYPQINEGFSKPEGCAYDPGTGSIYVADSGNSAVYKVPANFVQLQAIQAIEQIATTDGASDVLVLSSGASMLGATRNLILVAAVTIVGWSML